ncbi:serine/threonine-protein kinase atr, partial [Elysia marginata]
MCLILAKTLSEIAFAQADIGIVSRPRFDVHMASLEEFSVEVNPNMDTEAVKDRGKSLNLGTIQPFLQLLQHPNSSVRKNLLSSMSFIFDVINLESAQTRKIVESCLDLLDDPDLDIRMECSTLISHIVRKEELQKKQPSTASIDCFVWEKLNAANLKAHSHSNWALLETVLNAIGQFGRHTDGELLESALILLLESRLSRKIRVAAVASEELQGIAAFKKESLQGLYARYKQAVCKFLVEAMYIDQMNCDGVNTKSILATIASTLEAEDVKTLLQGGEKYILPFLVSKASPQSSKLIKNIANLQSSNNAETDFSLGNLLRLDFQRVHNELLLHLSSHYQQVFNGLKTLAANDEQYKGSKDIDSTEQMAQYLEPRLLGVLAFFDAQLMNSNITMQDKELALKSVISIIRLMGSKHITTIRHKVMNTLRLALNFREAKFVEISCKAWNCFVKSIELPLLGPMMSQVVATLLPLLQILPEQVVQIINYMIVENQAQLHKYFQDIYFLPDISELLEANAILKRMGDKSASDTDLKGILSRSIKGILHESLDVRAHALSKLRKILKDRWAELNNFVMNSEPAEPILSELVSALLSGCRETDANTQILYGQCLGELGAIDPGRLDLISKSPIAKLSSFHPSIDEDDFAFGLINIIVKAFLAATEPRVQDCAAFALQELLQIYEISGHGNDQGLNSNSQLWKKFPEQTQEILVPLTNSKYKLTVEAKYKNYPKPIYGSEKGKTFKDWVSNWTGYLISKVKSGKACQVFTACIATKRHNQQVALYMLPHIVLHVLLDGSPEEITELFEELMTVLQHVHMPESQPESISNTHHLIAQTVFSILDYLTMWRNHRMQITTQAASGAVKAAAYEKDAGYQAVNSFLDKIPQEIFARACFNCKAYPRALRHFEMFIASGQNIQQHLDFMQRLYVSMDEPDGVLGVAAVRISQPTLMQQILTHESLGQQQDAQACYERAIQMDPEEISHHMGLLRSLIDLAQPNKALIHTAGILAERPRWTAQLNSYRIEAAWELGNWDKLEEALNQEKHASSNWPVLVGKILLASKEKREADFVSQLELARKEQTGPLSAASMELGSYYRGYEHILRLHMINEIEEFFKVFASFPEEKEKKDVIVVTSPSDLLNNWQSRMEMAQSSFRTQEPILTLRRTLLSLVESERDPCLLTQIGKWWLWSAKVARKAGYLQSAHGCLLQASSYHLPDFYLEKAKWLWEKGEPDSAISCLNKGITEHFGRYQDEAKRQQLSSSLRQVYAKSLLLYGKYSEETSNLETNAVVKLYRDVIEICPDWEDGYFHLAKYYDRVMNMIIDEKERVEKQGEFIIHVVRFFGQSLKYGNQHIYQSLPRLLSLWLDYGTAVVDAEKKDRSKSSQKLVVQRTVLKRINTLIQQLNEQLAPYQMFTAFPQLISRICHAQPDVFQQLEEIISDLLLKYPQQAMWMMMSVSKSSYPMRVKRCQEIFVTAIHKDGNLTKFVQDCKKLTERLLELCEKDFGNCSTVNLNQSFKPLKRLLEDSKFSQILLPLQSAVTVKLPATVKEGMQHNPFPDTQIYIQGFDDIIEVLHSLQKPKKITMIGSDGNRYVMMCKPKDDLRKDCRLMEFNSIINRFLHRDAESRKRRLLIRTYTVTPLNEECGLIEWVNNTTGLRNILVSIYKEQGFYMSGKELKTNMPALHSSLENKMKIYKEKLLPRHPPLFPVWFMRTFPDPTS